MNTIVTYRTNWIDQLMNNFIRDSWFHTSDCAPTNKLVEHDNKYVYELALPGFNKKDVKLNIESNLIRISVSKTLKNKSTYQSQEYEHSFYLPEGANHEKVSAKMRDGLLKIEIPKVKAQAKSRQIPINGIRTNNDETIYVKQSFWDKLKSKFKS